MTIAIIAHYVHTFGVTYLLSSSLLRLSCVVHYVKGKPLYTEKTVYIKTHKTAINPPVDHTGETIGFFPYKSLYFECYATMPMLANAHISSLGYLWNYR